VSRIVKTGMGQYTRVTGTKKVTRKDHLMSTKSNK
jgi:hypothetical protein